MVVSSAAVTAVAFANGGLSLLCGTAMGAITHTHVPSAVLQNVSACPPTQSPVCWWVLHQLSPSSFFCFSHLCLSPWMAVIPDLRHAYHTSVYLTPFFVLCLQPSPITRWQWYLAGNVWKRLDSSVQVRLLVGGIYSFASGTMFPRLTNTGTYTRRNVHPKMYLYVVLHAFIPTC